MHPIDLHTHSTRSDGTLTPAELIRYAAQKGLAAIALTDHDTIDGIEEAVQAARSLSSQDPDALVCPPSTEVKIFISSAFSSIGRTGNSRTGCADSRTPEYTGTARCAVF